MAQVLLVGIVHITGNWSFNNNDSFAYWTGLFLMRDGVVLHEVFTAVHNGWDGALTITFMDEPPPGAHTYQIGFDWGGNNIQWYSSTLQVLEIKN